MNIWIGGWMDGETKERMKEKLTVRARNPGEAVDKSSVSNKTLMFGVRSS